MSDNIPFEIQAEIFKRLPVKSLIQIRSVCKAWKSLIDSADFIRNYIGQMQYILARYKDSVDFPEKYVLIADDHTFPQKKVSLNTQLLVNMLKYSRIIGCSHGLLCLYGDYQEGHDGPLSGSGRAVIWNPSIRKTITVDVPNVADCRNYETVLSFGVCRETNNPKIVKITHINRWGHRKSLTCIPCHVEVFTLSTRAWRHPYGSNPPRNSIEFDYYNMVVIDGMLNWLVIDRITVDGGLDSYNLIISFDMTSEEFREVNLPDSLAHKYLSDLSICKLRESLVVLERNVDANNLVFHVWIMEDVVPKSFTKLFAIDLPDADVSAVYVMGFRKTGEPIIDSASCYPKWTGSLAVYEPTQKPSVILGLMETIFHILCIPTWKRYFCFDQLAFTSKAQKTHMLG